MAMKLISKKRPPVHASPVKRAASGAPTSVRTKPTRADVEELLHSMDRRLDRAEARIDRVLEEQARRRA